MKKAGFTETQIVSILYQEQNGKPIKEICREHGISETTFSNWKTLYGRMKLNDVIRMNNLANENSALKTIIAKATSRKK